MDLMAGYANAVAKVTSATHMSRDQAEHLAKCKVLTESLKQVHTMHDQIRSLTLDVAQYVGRPLEVYGDLVHVGDVLFKDITSKEKLKPAFLFLFETALIVSKPKGTAFIFKSTIELGANLQIVDVPWWMLPKDEQDPKVSGPPILTMLY